MLSLHQIAAKLASFVFYPVLWRGRKQKDIPCSRYYSSAGKCFGLEAAIHLYNIVD